MTSRPGASPPSWTPSTRSDPEQCALRCKAVHLRAHWADTGEDTEGAVSGQDVLLATKLHVPRPRPGFLPRPRLVAALGDGLARGRVLVCAPAGFGKTALLADWARGSGQPVAWLGLDGGDSDPARFWRYVVAALDRPRPGLAGRLDPLLGQPAPRAVEGLVLALINEFAADPGSGEVLLVLDDY